MSGDKIDKLLQDYSESVVAAEQQAKATQDRKQQFACDFVELAKTVIKPVFDKYGERFNLAGHTSSVSLAEAYRPSDGSSRDQLPRITLRVQLRRPTSETRGGGYEGPHISYEPDLFQTKINCYASTIGTGHGGSGGGNGSFALEHMTAQAVEDAVVQWFERLVMDAAPRRH